MNDSSYDNINEDGSIIYALDIGTRSVIGMLAKPDGDRMNILAIEKQPHTKRAMMDGQIEDIGQVANVVVEVTQRLEKKMGIKLTRACVAAAGRALRTETGSAKLELGQPTIITTEHISTLEARAITTAEEILRSNEEFEQRLFLVGYTPSATLLDSYPMSKIIGHTGKVIETTVLATFLPSEVIDSLYAVMRAAKLEVASLTLEPIAALNAAIPVDLRLLNLALVDIGAGTSDIAICRDGSVVGYTMATVAGDEITEALMHACLVDYHTAESIKASLDTKNDITYMDILGMEQSAPVSEIMKMIEKSATHLAREISRCITDINDGAPSAVFIAGGGSKLVGLRELVATELEMDNRRVAIAGGHFKNSAYSDDYNLLDPEYTTPLGIAVSAGLGLISDSYRIMLNGVSAKLFRSGSITAMEVLMMNGFSYTDLLARSGKSLYYELEGKRKVHYGGTGTPATLEVNGVVAQPSSQVNPGDSITFVPATVGEDVVVTAGDIMKEHMSLVEVNGEIVNKAFEIPSGAIVKLVDPEVVRPITPPPPTVVEKVEKPVLASVEVEHDSTSTATQQAERVQEVVYTFMLNGMPLRLAQKPDASPYYLMDLLDYSGIDFKHLDRPVELLVNDKLCAFTQELANGDTVTITLQ